MAPANWPTTLNDLSNDAMDLLGEDQQFTDISTDTSDNGKIINRMIYRIIRENQAEFPWPELRAFESITTPDASYDNTTQESIFSYRYALPDDYLRPFNEELYRYEIKGQFVYSNIDQDLGFHYVKYTEEVPEWSPQLYQVIMYQLAIAACIQITQAPNLKGELLAYYEAKVLPGAKAIKSQSQRYPNRTQRMSGAYSRTRSNWCVGNGFIK